MERNVCDCNDDYGTHEYCESCDSLLCEAVRYKEEIVELIVKKCDAEIAKAEAFQLLRDEVLAITAHYGERRKRKGRYVTSWVDVP